MDCPLCNGHMHEVYFGDDVQRFRCMKCDAIYAQEPGEGRLVTSK